MKALKVKIHMCASDAANPRIRTVKAERRMNGLTGSENTDGAEITTIPASAPVIRSDTASLRVNKLETAGISRAGTATIGRESDMASP
jgi:hypothetical protein